MDAAMDKALTMPEEDRRARMAALSVKVRRYDIAAWMNEQRRVFTAIGGPVEAIGTPA
jgi:glucosylglycerol-phosphate synthase